MSAKLSREAGKNTNVPCALRLLTPALLTRSLPLARPSPACGFAPIAFAASQAAQVSFGEERGKARATFAVVGFNAQLPLVTLSVVGISVLVYLLPGIQALLVYDRAAILGGELWRVITCHWVHFSGQHFIYDTVAFGIAGWMIERRGYRNFGWLCALGAISISGSMLLCEPRLQICGGLSGLATAAVVFLAVHGLEEKGAWRWLCVAVLVLSAAKMAVELTTGRFVFLEARDGFLPVPGNHIAGALAAAGVYAWGRGLETRAGFGTP